MPVEGPRGEQGFYVVSDGTNRPWRIKSRAAVAAGLPGARADDRRRPDCRRHRGHRLDRRRHGRRGPVSFHPKMAYGATFHKSSRTLDDEGRAVRLHAGEPRPLRRDRHSAIRPIAGARRCCRRSISRRTSRATSPPTRCATSPSCSASRRADVEDVVSYYTMFYTKPVGKFVLQRLPDAVVRAERRRARHRGAARQARDQAGRDRRQRHVHAARSRVPRRVRSRAGGDGQRRLARVPDAGERVASWSTTCARAAKRRSRGCHHVVEQA